MRLWIGIVTFVIGIGLWYRSHGGAGSGPAWLGRLGLGASALGLSTLSMTRPGLPWTISSICFSIVAIILLGTVVLELLRAGNRRERGG
jgi:hypothetical protein